jgi:hypothetical protein
MLVIYDLKNNEITYFRMFWGSLRIKSWALGMFKKYFTTEQHPQFLILENYI